MFELDVNRKRMKNKIKSIIKTNTQGYAKSQISQDSQKREVANTMTSTLADRNQDLSTARKVPKSAYMHRRTNS